MPLEATVSVSIKSALSAALDLSTPKDNLFKKFSQAFADGSGANRASNIFHDKRTLASGANEDLDLAASLTNALGQAAVFTKLKALLVYSRPTNTTNLTVSRPASNGVPIFSAAGDALVLKPGAMFLFTDPSLAGVTVTASTGDLINVANAAGASADYDIVAIGV